MKKLAMVVLVITMMVVPLMASAQTTTNTAFQVVNLSDTTAANIVVTFYDTSGAETHSFSDTINASSSKSYAQANMSELGTTFDGSVIVASDQEIAAIVNQSTTGSSAYNGSYTGFATGSDTFYLPVVLNNFFGWYTEISVQNASSNPVDVTVTYSSGCTDTATALGAGAAARFDNRNTCSGGLDPNGSATISATGPVVAMVNQISPNGNKEQTYNGFSPSDGNDTLYTPIALKNYFNFNSSFQVQNISGASMDIIATYSDGVVTTVTNVADGDAATFAQRNEAHSDNWAGSAIITNSTGGAMVGIVNQASSKGKASSFNMFSGGSAEWALPSLLHDYYGGYNSSFQVQNISGAPVNISVTYSDGLTASATNVPDNGVALFAQGPEAHATRWGGSAIVSATGDVVIVVNQDAPGTIDKQYSYNAVPLTP